MIAIRQVGVRLFTFQLVGPKLHIKLLVILVLTYGITYPINLSTNVSYSSFKHIVKLYIQNNSHIIYRLNNNNLYSLHESIHVKYIQSNTYNTT